MKKKHLTILVLVLACCALASIGFASWIITRPTDPEVKDGQITVEAVTTQEIQFTAEIVDNKAFHFGPNATKASNKAASWLAADQANESLTVQIKITLTAGKDFLADDAFTITFEVVDNDGKFASAVSAGYIKDPKTITVEVNKTDFSDGNEATKEVTLEWGSHFGNQNPMDFYSQYDANESVNETTAIEDAKTSLEALEELTGVTYKVTVTAHAKTTSN